MSVLWALMSDYTLVFLAVCASVILILAMAISGCFRKFKVSRAFKFIGILAILVGFATIWTPWFPETPMLTRWPLVGLLGGLVALTGVLALMAQDEAKKSL